MRDVPSHLRDVAVLSGGGGTEKGSCDGRALTVSDKLQVLPTTFLHLPLHQPFRPRPVFPPVPLPPFPPLSLYYNVS
jgi:hypothetical protein